MVTTSVRSFTPLLLLLLSLSNTSLGSLLPGGHNSQHSHLQRASSVGGYSWKSVGCAIDQTSLKLLNGSKAVFPYRNTLSTCTSTCQSQSFTLAGMETGSQCYCGNSLTAALNLTSLSQCSTPCPGNNKTFCGGPNRMLLYNYTADVSTTLPTQIIVTGASGGSSAGASAANRLEINDFIKDVHQFSLYIQALNMMSADNQTHLQSFFDVAGIHGLPNAQYSGSGSPSGSASSNWAGYCAHGSSIFPTWHRPYLVLQEQILQNYAIQIAQTFKNNQSVWIAAAYNFRHPYWDWAKNATPPAEVISLETVDVIVPSGALQAVTNPLRRYVFHPIDKSFTGNFAVWPVSLRHPTSNTASAADNVTDLVRYMQSAQTDFTSKIYHLLSQVTTWPAFASHDQKQGGSTSTSLEGIHDSIHVDIGGGGHMANPLYGGFDPIFMLHHSNVDRLLQLWSALNPGVWVTPSTQTAGSYTLPAGSTVDMNSDLTPFFKTNTTYFKSQNITSTMSLNYTYPEFNGLDMSDTAAVKSAIQQKVNQLYGASTLQSFRNGTSTAPPPTTRKRSPRAASHKGRRAAVNGAKYIWDWAANISFRRHALSRSFSVYIFLGPVPSNPDQWRDADNYIGSYSSWVPTSDSSVADDGESTTAGTVYLNPGIALFSNLSLPGFPPKKIKPYLKANLYWRIVEADGTPVSANDTNSLKITVQATKLALVPGEIFPVVGETRIFHSITHGRVGGDPSSSSNQTVIPPLATTDSSLVDIRLSLGEGFGAELAL